MYGNRSRVKGGMMSIRVEVHLEYVSCFCGQTESSISVFNPIEDIATG